MNKYIFSFLLSALLIVTASCAKPVPRTLSIEVPVVSENTSASNISAAAPIGAVIPAQHFTNETIPVLPANTTTSALRVPPVQLPDEKPVIFEDVKSVMRGEFYKLYIYADGTAYSITEKGLRMPINPPTRTWKKGHVSEADFKTILALFQSEQFSSLNGSYKFPGEPILGGPLPGFKMGDGGFTFTVDYGGLHDTVYAFGYLSPDDMPAPLNEIYAKLSAVEQTLTVISTENITTNE